MVIIAFSWCVRGTGLCVSLHSNERFLNYPPIVSSVYCTSLSLEALKQKHDSLFESRQTFWKNTKQITACHLQIFCKGGSRTGAVNI